MTGLALPRKAPLSPPRGPSLGRCRRTRRRTCRTGRDGAREPNSRVAVGGGRRARVELNLGVCGLVGPIDASLAQCIALHKLVLDWNRLEGEVPAWMGKLTGLTTLLLGNNLLRGPIPTALGQCTKLQMLGLNDNALSGPVPVGALQQLKSLTWLSLGAHYRGAKAAEQPDKFDIDAMQ